MNNAGAKRDFELDRDIDDYAGRETARERETIRAQADSLSRSVQPTTT